MSGSLVDPITLENQRLICDVEGCGYEEPCSELTPDLIGKPCPRCGASLLTEDDYKAAKMLLGAVAMINADVGPVPDSNDAIRVSFNPRGESA